MHLYGTENWLFFIDVDIDCMSSIAIVLYVQSSFILCTKLTFFFLRNGRILFHCGLQTLQVEEPWRHEDVSAPYPHACYGPRIRGGSYDYWYVQYYRLLDPVDT